MPRIFSDVRFAARLLWRSPGFTLVSVLALALGIGANTAIFTAIDRILLRPLPYHEAGRLVFVWEDASQIGFPRNNPAPANFFDWKAQNRVFSDISASRYTTGNLTGDGAPELVFGRGTMANLFAVLGVRPQLGRTFTEAEDKAGASVMVISHALWQRRYGGETSVVGKRVELDGISREIIGVMPAGFHFPDRNIDYWVPVNFTPQVAARRGSHFLTAVARLKPGVTLEQARSEMQTIARQLEQCYPETNTGLGIVVVPAREQIVGERSTAGLWVLMAASGCVLLIACANIANLLLARAASREREMAIRSALGARRGQLIRQLLAESGLLSLAGGVAGLAVGSFGLQIMEKFIPQGLGGSEHLSIDGGVLAFTLAVALVTGLTFGLAPALRGSGVPVNESLKEGSRGNVRAGGWLRDALVVAEVAMALVLLAGAGLMIQTLGNLRSLALGFDADSLLTMRTVLPQQKYDTDAKRVAFYDGALEKIRALPGVESAAFSSNLPFTTIGNTNGYRIEGRPDPPPSNVQDALYREVTNHYFQTLRARLKEGRFFDSRESASSLRVVIINEFFAKAHFPNESAVGKRIQVSGDDTWYTIAGVVEDLRERGVGLEMKPAVYLPVSQVQRPGAGFLAVRTTVAPESLTSAVRQAIWSVDSRQPVFGVRTMHEILDLAVSDQRQQMTLLGAFAMLALTLASIGIYGVLSYTVELRRREIGVRMALGATAGAVVRNVLRHGVLLAGVGLAIGLSGAMAATRFMQSMLFGIAPNDAATLAGVSAILACTATIACVVPAWRAARVDPIVTLRDE